MELRDQRIRTGLRLHGTGGDAGKLTQDVIPMLF